MTRAPGLEEAAPAEFLFDENEVADEPTEYLFDIHQLEAMTEAGVFGDSDAKIELLDGRIIQMPPPSGRHGWIVGGVMRQLVLAIQAAELSDLHLITHGGLMIDPRNVFDPDMSIARGRPSETYFRPSELALVVEVSNTSGRRDLVVKMRKYAAAGVPEYWAVELRTSAVHVFRSPSSDGYSEETVASGDDRIEPLFGEGRISIRAGDLF